MIIQTVRLLSKFIIYLQRNTPDITLFPTQKYKILYLHLLRDIFRITITNIIPNWAITILITKITTLSDVSAISLYHFFGFCKKKGIKQDKCIIHLCGNMFTQCDIIKNLAWRYLLQRCNVLSHSINFLILLITKTEVFVVVFMYVYNKNIITLVTWSDWLDHVSWMCQ